MKKIILFTLIALEFIAYITIQQADAKVPVAELSSNTLPDIVAKVSGGVVNIQSTTFVARSFYGNPFNNFFFDSFGIPKEQIEKQSSRGSGFIVENNGYILTNFHVIKGANEVVVITQDKKRYDCRIVGLDQMTDIALLKTNKTEQLQSVPLGNSDSSRIGETVFAIGNPFGLQHTVTAGIISAKNRTIGQGPYDNFLQTDASINFGNSGGPLFNMKGEVIGINTAINAQGQGLGFAIPINDAKAIMASLKQFGKVQRVWLGIIGIPITPALKNYYGIAQDHGVIISNLFRIGPAAINNFQIGDIIDSVNDKKILEKYDIEKILKDIKPNESVSIELKRGGKIINKKIKLTEFPQIDDIPDGLI